MSRRNRVIEIDRSKTSPEQERVLDKLTAGRGKILTPYKIWIHAPTLAEGLEMVGTHINTASTLTDAELEAAILMVAVHWGSPFVTKAHTKHGLKAGLPQVLVDDILAKRPVHSVETKLGALLDLVNDALQRGASVEDEAYDRYAEALGRDGLAEVIALIGYFTAVSLAMRLHEVLPAE